MTIQCSSCGGFCGKRCQRENIKMESSHPSKEQHMTEPTTTPDWKAEYLKTVDLHCITLDELREAQADLKEARHANEKHIARIVGLQDEIRNLTGEE